MKRKLTEEHKQQAIDNYVAWAYADPKYKEFTDQLIIEYLDTGVKPSQEEIERRFREFLEEK